MESITFPVGKLCRIRKVLASNLYFVVIEKTEAGPINVIVEPEDNSMTEEQKKIGTLSMETNEELFVSMLDDTMIGNVGLEEILSNFVKSLVLDRETKILSAIKIDREAEHEKIVAAKKEAERIEIEKDKKDQDIRDQKARKRAEREMAKIENIRLAKQHLLEKVVYARKIMQIEVKRLGALKKAREERERKLSEPPPLPSLVLPTGKLLRVRRVINSEMASLEIAKIPDPESEGEWNVMFTTEGLDSGQKHSLTTTEAELTSMLQEVDYEKETGDLLRLFSKMIAFDQKDDNPGLRLHQVDEAAEKERIRQWRDQALRVEGATTSIMSSPKKDSNKKQQPTVAVAALTNSNSNSMEDTLATISTLAAGENTMEIAFERTKMVGKKVYLVTMRLSGHKLFVSAKTKDKDKDKNKNKNKNKNNDSSHSSLEYSCSLEHALMLLPSEQQLWDTEMDLFTSLFSCVQLQGGRTLSLRRRLRGGNTKREELVATTKVLQESSIPESQRIQEERIRAKAIYKRRSGNGRGEMSSDLQRKIDEHYMTVGNMDSLGSLDSLDSLDSVGRRNGGGGERGRRRRKKRFKDQKVRLKSLGDKAPDPRILMDEEDADEIKDRLLSLEDAHRFLLPASRGNGTGQTDDLPGAQRRIPRLVVPQNHGGFGHYNSSVMTDETILEQSSLLSVQGGFEARMRLQERLARDGFCGQERRGPDIDPLFPLEARSQGRFFLKKALRTAFGPATQMVKAHVPAPIIGGSRASRSKATIIQEVESQMIMADGGWLFQIASQHNSWGSPEKRSGPGLRTTACKFNRKNARKKKRKIMMKKMEMQKIKEHKEIVYRRHSVLKVNR